MRFLKFLLGSSGRLRALLIVAAIAGVVSGLTGIGLIALIQRALDPEAAKIANIGLIFAACCLVATAARVASVYLLTVLGQELVYDLRLRLCRQVLSAPLRQLETMGANRVLAALTSDINALLAAMMMVPVIAVNSTICLGAFGYMAYMNWKLFLIFLLFVAVGVASYQIPMLFGVRRYREAREEQDALFAHFRALTSGVKELKLHRERRGAFDDLLASTSGRLRDLFIQASLIYGSASAWGQMLFFVVIGLLLFARPADFGTDSATLIGFTLLLLYLVSPLQILLNSVPVAQQAEVSLNKLRTLDFELAETPEHPQAEPGQDDARVAAEPKGARFEQMEWIDVRHSYYREGQEGSFSLGPLSLSLKPGELVFLVGGNGSGKTTLAKVICGLYPPEEGEIRLDGVKVENSEDYRQLFSTVFDDFHLFEELLGLSGGQIDEDARRYLEELQLAHKVAVENGRLSTVELSKGQRKRLALLTAYLENRSIYLFDEWAADQDPVFKNIFYHQILPNLKAQGKAVLAITHDDRYFDLADRVLKLEHGQLVRFGGDPVPEAGTRA